MHCSASVVLTINVAGLPLVVETTFDMVTVALHYFLGAIKVNSGAPMPSTDHLGELRDSLGPIAVTQMVGGWTEA